MIIFLKIILLIFLSIKEITNVMELNTQNFYEVLNRIPVAMVVFYAPWCHHCHELMPEYELAESLLGQDRIFGLYKFDCDQGRQFCESLKIPGFPIVKIFNYGTVVDNYEGERKASSLVEYFKSKYSIFKNKPSLIEPPSVVPENLFSKQFMNLLPYNQIFMNLPIVRQQQQEINPPTYMNNIFQKKENPWNIFENRVLNSYVESPYQNQYRYKPFEIPIGFGAFSQPPPPPPAPPPPPVFPFPYVPGYYQLPNYFNRRLGSDRLQNFLYYQNVRPMVQRINSPLPQFYDSSYISRENQPQQAYYPFRQAEFFNPFPRTFDVLGLKKDSLSRVENILWNPNVDLAHRALIKQTIYPQKILKDIYRSLQQSNQLDHPLRDLFKRQFYNSLPILERNMSPRNAQLVESEKEKKEKSTPDILDDSFKRKEGNTYRIAEPDKKHVPVVV